MVSRGPFDVVVVGAGVVGCSVAYFARLRGMTVAVLDKALPGTEASGRNGGGVRQQRRDWPELPIAMEGVRLWSFFRDELGGDFEYVQKGNVQVALTDRQAEELSRSAADERSRGLEVFFLDRDELREVVPAIAPEVVAAQYCPTDGTANPIKASRFVAKLAQESGAEMHPLTRVVELEAEGDMTRATTDKDSRFLARRVVLANGPWVNELAGPLGSPLPILPRRSQNLVTTPTARVLGQFVSGNTVYVRQTKAGNLQVGGSGDWEPQTFDQSTTSRTLTRFACRAAQLVPAVRETSVLRSWAGTLDLTPDRLPIIDWLPGVPGVLVSAGFSAHGFCLGPAVGKVVAELLCDEEPSLPLQPLRADRFPPQTLNGGWYEPRVEPAPMGGEGNEWS